MTPLAVSGIVFVCVFGGAILGLSIATALPEHHLSQDTRDVVKLATALIATMAALVLSLLISSAKGSFDTMEAELVQNAARTIQLDRALADYGPETRDLRDLLKRSYAARIERLFPNETSPAGKPDSPQAVAQTESLQARLWDLSPQTEAQRGLRAQAVEIASEMSATRWLLRVQRDRPIPMALLTVLVFWLAIIFATFGLFAPRNATVVTALLVCALSVSGAIFLILEMNDPFSGLIKVSDAPMRDALSALGQ